MWEVTKKMDKSRVLKALIRRWWLILLIAILSTGSTAYITLNVLQSVYRGEAFMFLMVNNNIGMMEPRNYELSGQLVTDYREILKSPFMAQRIIQTLGLDLSMEEVQDNIIVTSPKESRLISIAYESYYPELAARIVNTAAELSISQMESITGVITGQLIQPSDIPKEPVKPNKSIHIMAGILAGLLLGCCLALLMEMLDKRIRYEKDIEQELGLKIIGRIESTV